MLDTIVRYLHESLTPFRLASYPSMEHVPQAVQPLPRDGVHVETQLVVVGGRLSLVCFAAKAHADLAALSNELGSSVIDAEHEDLPDDLQRFEAPPPPLGQLFGLPLILDDAIPNYGVIVFQPFGESDYFEIPYDDFARQEQPRLASFARAGELAAGAQPVERPMPAGT